MKKEKAPAELCGQLRELVAGLRTEKDERGLYGGVLDRKDTTKEERTKELFFP